MLKNWNLKDLCQNGMKYESGAAGEEKISGGAINKISLYKFSNLKKIIIILERMTKRKNVTDVVYHSNQIIQKNAEP